MASHASALKAHRQSLKNRERNRQFRVAAARRAEEHPHRHRRQRSDRRQNRAQGDDLADRQDGEQGRHPPQRRRPLQVAAQHAPRRREIPRRPRSTQVAEPALRLAVSAVTRAATIAPPRFPHKLDDQPLEQHARVAGRALQVQIRPEHRVDAPGGRSPARSRETSRARPIRAGRGSSRAARRRPASARAGAAPSRRPPASIALVIAQSSCSAAGPVISPHVVERDRLLAERVEQQAIDVVAQPLDVGARTARRAGAPPPDRSAAPAAATRVLHPALGVRQILDDPAFDERRLLRQQLVHPAALVERARDEDERRLRLGLLEQLLRARRARAPPPRSRASAPAAPRPAARSRRGAAPSSAASGRRRRARPTPAASRRRWSSRRRACARR